MLAHLIVAGCVEVLSLGENSVHYPSLCLSREKHTAPTCSPFVDLDIESALAVRQNIVLAD